MAMEREAAATAIRFDGVIITGGFLKQPWGLRVEHTEVVDGTIFYLAHRTDRAFAKYVGLNMQDRSPWQDNSVLDFLRTLRNTAVEEELSKLFADVADPLADQQVQVSKKARVELRDKVPDIIWLTLPAYGPVPEWKLRVLSGTKSSDVFGFEVTEENFNHMILLVANPPSIESRRWSSRSGSKYSDDFPSVKLFSRGVGWRMETRRNGVRKCKAIPHTNDDVAWKTMADEVARELQEWSES